MFTAGQPLLEVDRLFAAPKDRRKRLDDAQRQAVERLVLSCERIRPHLHNAETFQRFLGLQRDPSGLHRRISLALAIETPDREQAYGRVGQFELETFRSIAQRKLAAVIWVFS
jgi:hypothetical protein